MGTWRLVPREESLQAAKRLNQRAATRRAARSAAVQRRRDGLEHWAAREGSESTYARWTTQQLRELLHGRGVKLGYAQRVERVELIEQIRKSTPEAAPSGDQAVSTTDGDRCWQAKVERVRLGTIACSGLDNEDYMTVVVLSKDAAGRWRELGCTEIVCGSASPRFKASLTVESCWERVQSLRLEVVNVDLNSTGLAEHDIIGRTSELQLSDLVAARGRLDAELMRPGNAGGVGMLTATVELLRGSWNGVVEHRRPAAAAASTAAPDEQLRASRAAAEGATPEERMWQHASADWRRKRDRSDWWLYHALMPRVWSTWSARANPSGAGASDDWDATATADMMESQADAFRRLHAGVLDMTATELKEMAEDIFQLWRYHDTITLAKPRTRDDVAEILRQWVGRERVLWARVWKKHMALYPQAFPVPRGAQAAEQQQQQLAGDAAAAGEGADASGAQRQGQSEPPAAAATASGGPWYDAHVSPETAELRKAMVQQVLSRCER